MPQWVPRGFAAISRVVALSSVLTLGVSHAQAQTQVPAPMLGVLGVALDLTYLVAVQLMPLLPLLAGAGLFMLSRSHVIAAGLPAIGFGAWAAFFFARTSLDGPLSGALYGVKVDGFRSALIALAGSGYAHLITADARRMGKRGAMLVHGAGIAFALAAFVMLVLTQGSDTTGIALYLVMLALTLGLAVATGSFAGVVATMTLALVAMAHGLLGAAIWRGVHDAGQAYIAILHLPKFLLPVLAAAGIGKWLGGYVRARRPV